MIEHKRQKEYAKNTELENDLSALNQMLAHQKVELENSELGHPIVFIVGAPRSGSTLFSQVLASTGLLGYVSNFMARFWSNPALGAVINETILNPLLNKDNHGFSSIFGVSEGINGPHEFGYFWEKWFEFNQKESHQLASEELLKINHMKLKQEISEFINVTGKPFFFKNLTCSYQISYLQKLFPEAIFIVCYRTPEYQVQSILNVRQKLLGSYDHWWSLMPAEYPELKSTICYHQVAGQVYYTLNRINTSLATIPEHQKLFVRYDRFCKKPIKLIEQLFSMLNISDYPQSVFEQIPESFECSDSIFVSDDIWDRIKEACCFFCKEELAGLYHPIDRV